MVTLHPGLAGGVEGALDLDLGNAGIVELLLQHLADLVVFHEGIAELSSWR